MYLTTLHVNTLVKGAVVGPTSNLNRAGQVYSCIVSDAVTESSWDHVRSVAALRPRKTGIDGKVLELSRDRHGENDVDVLQALCKKVSGITMMAMEEVPPERSLVEYELDFLVSVELRNWIRGEFGVELALTQIVGVATLQALADVISARRGR